LFKQFSVGDKGIGGFVTEWRDAPQLPLLSGLLFTAPQASQGFVVGFENLDPQRVNVVGAHNALV
jgi:hypothetical protein